LKREKIYRLHIMLKNQFIISDKELWDKFIGGDREAYRAIYERNFDDLFNYGVRFTFDHDSVKDCIQDLFIDLHKYKYNLKRTEKIIPYLMVSLKRKLVKKNQQKNKQIDLDTESLPFDYLLQEEVPDEPNAELNRQLVQNALNSITARQREAIYLRYVTGLNYEELAEVMKMSYQGARTLIYRGMEKLRSKLPDKSIILFFVFRKLNNYPAKG
jgi:RNA polymerase sigma factor (sigma-70 family)